MIATPEIAGLPYVISGLVAAGGLAAALSTADGLLLAIANALSHDVYYKMLDPNAPTTRRLIVARVLLVLRGRRRRLHGLVPAGRHRRDGGLGVLAGGGRPVPGAGARHLVEADDLARAPIAGMIAGFGITLLYLVVTRYYPVFGVEALGMTSLLNPVTGAPVVDVAAALADPATAYTALASKVGWFNINNISSAIFGLPLGTLVMIVVSA